MPDHPISRPRHSRAIVPCVLLVWLAMIGPAVLAQANPPADADAAPEATETRGTVEAVTVYRGQALVTRVVETGDGAGLREIVVTDLPARVVPGSVYAEGEEGVAIRSVRYRARPVREDVREEVRELDERITEIQRELEEKEQRLRVVNNQQTLFNKLEEFIAPTAQAELKSGVLNAETLERLTQLLGTQREELAGRELELQFEQEDLREQLEQLNRERSTLASSSSRMAREAVIFADVDQAPARIRLRYLVEGATWSPSYNIRAGSEGERVTIEYLASARQTSGEDWTDVRMTLSTATPSLVAEPPELAALRVSLADSPRLNVGGTIGRDAAAVEEQVEQLKRRQVRLQQQRAKGSEEDKQRGQQGGAIGGYPGAAGEPYSGMAYNGGPFAPPGGMPGNRLAELDLQLNSLTADRQVLEMVAGTKRADKAAERRQEGLSVTYRLPDRTSLPSRDDQQLVRIASEELEAEIYRVAIPLLTDFIYREARLRNTLGTVLLAGPSNSYIDGEFVGRGSVPTVSEGQPLRVGLGIDSTLRASRDLIDRSERTQGGNKVVTFQYRLTVENFGDEPAEIRLFDRLPTPARDADIAVELLETSHELTERPEDGEAGSADRETAGRLRWDVTVPADATGGDALTVDYRFSLEFDRQKTLSGAIEQLKP